MEHVATEIGERLETVRAKEGISLRDFWRKVVGGEEGGPFEWSEPGDEGKPRFGYRTVTRYHSGERSAPVEYLIRVSEVFRLRIAWLVEGGGTMRRPSWKRGLVHHHLFAALKDRDFFESFPLHRLGEQWTFLNLQHLYENSYYLNVGRRFHRNELQRAEDLQFALRLPLIAVGYGHVSEVPVEYWRGVMHGLDSAVSTFLDRNEDQEEPFVLALRDAYDGPETQE